MPLNEDLAIMSVDEVLMALGFSEDSTNEIERLVGAGSRAIERHCREFIKSRDVTLILSGPNHPLLDLGAKVLAITSVTMDGQVVADYKILAERGQLYRDGGWAAFSPLSGFSAGINNVAVEGTFGMSPVPEDYKEALLAWIRHQLARRGREGLSSERFPEYAYSVSAVTSTSDGGTGIPEIDALPVRWSV